MPEHWLMFVAGAAASAIAASLIAHRPARGASPTAATGAHVEHVPCLHFEACYYQPLAWCIAHGYRRFEGGAQGEHKMARGLLPVQTWSAHWLAHPQFAQAVADFLAREGAASTTYVDELNERRPFKALKSPASTRAQSVRLEVRAQRGVDLLQRQLAERLVDLRRDGEGAAQVQVVRQRRRPGRRPARATGGGSSAGRAGPRPAPACVKPSFSARASSSLNAASTLARFCGAKIALALHASVGSMRIPVDAAAHVVATGPRFSRMRFHRRELPPAPNR